MAKASGGQPSKTPKADASQEKSLRLRESGYRGGIDHNGDAVRGDPVKHLELVLGRKLRGGGDR